MIDNNYVESMQAWFKNLELTMEQTKNSIRYNESEIELHNKIIEVDKLQLAHDGARYCEAKEKFEQYLQENG